ncbi:MAG: hypothetical protein AVDCRST_MAG13-2850, partial [uncultured Solirubrobacteraceae bacterium]
CATRTPAPPGRSAPPSGRCSSGPWRPPRAGTAPRAAARTGAGGAWA